MSFSGKVNTPNPIPPGWGSSGSPVLRAALRALRSKPRFRSGAVGRNGRPVIPTAGSPYSEGVGTVDAPSAFPDRRISTAEGLLGPSATGAGRGSPPAFPAKPGPFGAPGREASSLSGGHPPGPTRPARGPPPPSLGGPPPPLGPTGLAGSRRRVQPRERPGRRLHRFGRPDRRAGLQRHLRFRPPSRGLPGLEDRRKDGPGDPDNACPPPGA